MILMRQMDHREDYSIKDDGKKIKDDGVVVHH